MEKNDKENLGQVHSGDFEFVDTESVDTRQINCNSHITPDFTFRFQRSDSSSNFRFRSWKATAPLGKNQKGECFRISVKFQTRYSGKEVNRKSTTQQMTTPSLLTHKWVAIPCNSLHHLGI